MRERESWSVAGDDRTVVEMCAGKGTETCPIKSFYFKPDVAFMKSLNAALR